MSTQNKIKNTCKNCGAVGYSDKPAEINEYLIEMVYSACPNCKGGKK